MSRPPKALCSVHIFAWNLEPKLYDKCYSYLSVSIFRSGHNGYLKVRLTLVKKLDKSFPLTKLLALMSRGSIQFDTGALGNLLLP